MPRFFLSPQPYPASHPGPEERKRPCPESGIALPPGSKRSLGNAETPRQQPRPDRDRRCELLPPQTRGHSFDRAAAKFRRRYPDFAVQVTAPDELLLVPMDAILMEQVLLNLLENAALHGG